MWEKRGIWLYILYLPLIFREMWLQCVEIINDLLMGTEKLDEGKTTVRDPCVSRKNSELAAFSAD